MNDLCCPSRGQCQMNLQNTWLELSTCQQTIFSSTRLKLERSKYMQERDVKRILYILLTKNICLGMSNKIFTVPVVTYDVQKTRN